MSNSSVVDSVALKDLVNHFREEGYTRLQVRTEAAAMLADETVEFSSEWVRSSLAVVLLSAGGGACGLRVSKPMAEGVLTHWRIAEATRGQVRSRLFEMSSMSLDLTDGARGVLNAAWQEVK